MRRREFIAGIGGVVAAWPLRADAQGARKPLIGILFHSNPEPVVGQLRSALARLGHRDGDTIELDVRVANGSEARLAEMAGDLVARKVDAIFAFTTPAALAAKAATASIPIVISAADPVGSGLVASLARPGGNITGMSLAVPEIAGKILGLLHEALPAARRIGALVNASDPFHRRLVEGIEAANRIVKLDLRVHGLAKPDELETAFAQMVADKIDAGIVQPTCRARQRLHSDFGIQYPYGIAGSWLCSGWRLLVLCREAVGNLCRNRGPDRPDSQRCQTCRYAGLATDQSLNSCST